MFDSQILITGGTGFVGSHLVEKLLETEKAENIHVTSFSQKSSYLNSLISQQNIHQVDLTNKQEVDQVFHVVMPKYVFHLAAFAEVGSSFANTERVLENNLKLQVNTLESFRTITPQARFLMVGSGMEYDLISNLPKTPIKEDHPLGPVSPYGVSKVFQDLLSLSYFYTYQTDIVRVRPFNHTGERQSEQFVIPSFAKQIVAVEKGEQNEIRVGDLSAIRDFSDVKDIVSAYILLMNKGIKGQVYNLGSGRGYKISDVLQMLLGLSKVPIKVVADPDRIRKRDVSAVVADNQKITALGFEPKYKLANTLERVINYWRQK